MCLNKKWKNEHSLRAFIWKELTLSTILKHIDTDKSLTGTEWPLMSTGFPVSLSNLPIRGPITAAATKAATPPAQWTIPLPAKSYVK